MVIAFNQAHVLSDLSKLLHLLADNMPDSQKMAQQTPGRQELTPNQ